METSSDDDDSAGIGFLRKSTARVVKPKQHVPLYQTPSLNDGVVDDFDSPMLMGEVNSLNNCTSSRECLLQILHSLLAG